jgi:hypothetical protein
MASQRSYQMELVLRSRFRRDNTNNGNRLPSTHKNTARKNAKHFFVYWYTNRRFPSHLLKASVQQLKNQRLCLLDTGNFHVPSVTIRHHCFWSFTQNTITMNKWCFDWVDLPESYQQLLADISQGNIWIVCDGSYHQSLQYGPPVFTIRDSSLDYGRYFFEPPNVW